MPSREEEFMSLAEVREFVGRVGPTAAKKVLGDLTGVPVRMSQVVVKSVDYNARQCTVQEFGDPVQKTNVAWLPTAYTPRVSDVAWLLKWGNDSLLIGQGSGISFSTPNHGRIPSAQIRQSTPPGVPASFVWTKYTFDTKGWDTDGMVVGSAPWDELVIWTPGLYHFECAIYFTDATTVPVMRGLRLADDTMSFWWDEDVKVYDNTVNITNEQSLRCEADVMITNGTVPVSLCMWAAQGGGGALGVLNRGLSSPRLSARYCGPEP